MDVTEADMLLFPPEDVPMQEASEIFVRNLHEETERFMERTIAEIAEKRIFQRIKIVVLFVDLI